MHNDSCIVDNKVHLWLIVKKCNFTLILLEVVLATLRTVPRSPPIFRACHGKVKDRRS